MMKKTKILIPVFTGLTAVSTITPTLALTSCSNHGWFGTGIWVPDINQRAKMNSDQTKWGLSNEEAESIYFDAIFNNPKILLDDYHWSSSGWISKTNWMYDLDLQTYMSNLQINKEQKTINFDVGFKCSKSTQDSYGNWHGGKWEINIKVINFPISVRFASEYDCFVFGARPSLIETDGSWRMEGIGTGTPDFYNEIDHTTYTFDLSNKTVVLDKNAINDLTKISLEQEFMFALLANFFPTINHVSIAPISGIESFYLSSAKPVMYCLPTFHTISLKISEPSNWTLPIELNPKYTDYIQMGGGYCGFEYLGKCSDDIVWDTSAPYPANVTFTTADLAKSQMKLRLNFDSNFAPTTSTIVSLRLFEMSAKDVQSRDIQFNNLDYLNSPLEIHFVK